MDSVDVATTPAEVLEPPKQAQVEDIDSAQFDAQKDDSDVRETTVDWTVSEDFDMSDAKKKPAPRQPVPPTYRGWKEVGHFENADTLTGDDEAVDLLSRGSLFDLYLPAVAYGDWYHNVGYLIAQREFSIRSIENDYETMDWLNVFLEKFWHFLEPSVAQIVTDQVNPILAASPAPAFVKSLWLDAFTAGT
ncbi:hypothetical protein OXX79_005773, partial [Metschnikowia pulcherrima]